MEGGGEIGRPCRHARHGRDIPVEEGEMICTRMINLPGEDLWPLVPWGELPIAFRRHRRETRSQRHWDPLAALRPCEDAATCSRT